MLRQLTAAVATSHKQHHINGLLLAKYGAVQASNLPARRKHSTTEAAAKTEAATAVENAGMSSVPSEATEPYELLFKNIITTIKTHDFTETGKRIKNYRKPQKKEDEGGVTPVTAAEAAAMVQRDVPEQSQHKKHNVNRGYKGRTPLARKHIDLYNQQTDDGSPTGLEQSSRPQQFQKSQPRHHRGAQQPSGKAATAVSANPIQSSQQIQTDLVDEDAAASASLVQLFSSDASTGSASATSKPAGKHSHSKHATVTKKQRSQDSNTAHGKRTVNPFARQQKQPQAQQQQQFEFNQSPAGMSQSRNPALSAVLGVMNITVPEPDVFVLQPTEDQAEEGVPASSIAQQPAQTQRTKPKKLFSRFKNSRVVLASESIANLGEQEGDESADSDTPFAYRPVKHQSHRPMNFMAQKLSIRDLQDASTGIKYRRDLSSLTADDLFKQLPQDKVKSRWDRKNFSELEIHEKSEVFRSPEEPPELSHGLDRVLTDSGVHLLYDPANDRFNFSPSLGRVHQPSEIEQRAIAPFVTTSLDERLHQIAKDKNCRYKGSTSSLSGVLVPLYLLLSNFKPTFSSQLESFRHSPMNFTRSVRKPNSIILRPHPQDSTVYGIDAWRPPVIQNNGILIDLGKSLERMLCMDQTEFERRFVKNSVNAQMRDDEFEYERDSYAYMKVGGILARSQLDCKSEKLVNESDLFDLKTRAINAIRMNVADYRRFTEMTIQSITGQHQSYEREFYDLIRSAFIKYSFQARIGSMGGMFMAYHNTKEMFGFEYIRLQEIDTYVFGSHYMGEQCFFHSMSLLEKICDLLTHNHPGVPLKLTFYVRKVDPYFLDIYVEPVPGDKGWAESKESMLSAEQARLLENPFNLNKQVYCYRLGVEVHVNGRPSLGFLHFTEKDKVDVSYTLQLRSSYKNDPYLFSEYCDVINRSALV